MSDPFARERTMHEVRTRRVRVVRTADIAPRLRRITVAGDDLAGFRADGPADHVKVFFPDPVTDILTVPEPGGFRSPAADGSLPILRDYTPVAFRAEGPAGPELDLDFVLHGDHGVAGPWASRAQVGDELGIGGPRGSLGAPAGASRAVIVADESALPAAARWLRAFAAIPVLGLFLVDDPDVATYLSGSRTGAHDLRWFTGADREASLDAALRAAPIDAGTFCFLAGEATTLIPLRRYLRRELGLGRAQADVHGYWKRGVAALDHHAPLDPGDPDD